MFMHRFFDELINKLNKNQLLLRIPPLDPTCSVFGWSVESFQPLANQRTDSTKFLITHPNNALLRTFYFVMVMMTHNLTS